MALSDSSLLALDVVQRGRPYCQLPAKGTIDTQTLDYVQWGRPFAVQPERDGAAAFAACRAGGYASAILGIKSHAAGANRSTGRALSRAGFVSAGHATCRTAASAAGILGVNSAAAGFAARSVGYAVTVIGYPIRTYPGIKSIRLRGPARVMENFGPRREIVITGPTRTMRFPQ